MDTTAVVGYFETEDRDSVICLDCEPVQDADGADMIDDAITADWDGVENFRCAHCGRGLVAVTDDAA